MRDLITILVVGGCLSLWTGAAVAGGPTQLKCGETSCQYTGEIGPSKTKEFEGFCTAPNLPTLNYDNSKMICHKAKGLTCAQGMIFAPGNYWYCTCTNWNDKHDAHTSIDLSCPSPS